MITGDTILTAAREAGSTWGQDIVPGAYVTSHGRHGAGQPAVSGRVISVEGQTVTIRTPEGPRRRTISNVRLSCAETVAQVRKAQAAIRTMKRNLRLGRYQGRNSGGDTSYQEATVRGLMESLPRGLQGDLTAEHGLALRISEAKDLGQERPELRARLAGVRRAIKRELEVL